MLLYFLFFLSFSLILHWDNVDKSGLGICFIDNDTSIYTVHGPGQDV